MGRIRKPVKSSKSERRRRKRSQPFFSPNNNGKRQLKIDDDDDTMSQTCVSKKSRKIDSSEHSGDDIASTVSNSYENGEFIHSLQLKQPDLINLSLRNKYSALVNEEPKNLKLGVVTNNSSNQETKKVDLNIVTNTGNDKRKSNDESVDDEKVMFKDLGGMDSVLDELRRDVIVPLNHHKLLRHLGGKPMSGILLHGPPGCGKTTLAHAIANEIGFPLYKISSTELISGISGASEENIRELFSKAYRTAPSIVFIDEIDVIASKREKLREMERRIVTQLMTCMDKSHRVAKPNVALENAETPNGDRGYVLVIGATNRPDALDPALRRPGRFDREYLLGIPDENARTRILSVLTQNVKLEGALDLVKISRSTPGYSGADLANLVTQAAYLAVNRIVYGRKSEIFKENTYTEQNEDGWRKECTPDEMEKSSIIMSDYEGAQKLVQPSSRREGFSSIPNVTWEDVGGVDFLRREFDRSIIRRIKYPDAYDERCRVKMETGFLLYGPPGCGKTLIAKAVANEARANFIHIKGPELLTKYVGESELAVRTIFSRARTCAPCVLFFDEVDSLTTKRGKDGGWVVERLLNQLLMELDGAEERKGVYIIGATNRPEVMDPAVLRSGRFGNRLYVPLPNPEERGMILKALARTVTLDADVDLIAIGSSKACDNFSGADLSALLNEAYTAADDERFSKTKTANEGTLVSLSESSLHDMPLIIKAIHFDQALGKISPSVSDKQIRFYNRLQKKFSSKYRKR